MSHFFESLQAIQEGRNPHDRSWVYVPYDQLSTRLGPLASGSPSKLAILLIESTWKPGLRPYHKQKLAWILASQRHFALELAEQGFFVHYVISDEDYPTILRSLTLENGPIQMMEAAELELRRLLGPLQNEGLLEVLPHQGWLTTTDQFQKSQSKEPPWRMDSFYRQVRRDTGILMKNGRPKGDQFSFDDENRKPWPGSPKAPEPPSFSVDPITEEVGALIEEYFSHHPGNLHLHRIAASAEDVERFWKWAKEECMEHFGPYEDAMSLHSRHLFHTLISPLLNLHRLLPAQVVDDVAALQIPLNSKEGFIRQVLGWREFIHHVYEATDGFQELPDPRDLNYLDAHHPLPDAYWGTPSGLGCLDEVVDSVVAEGYSHHITRLMILSNIAALLDLDPRAVTDWFWVMYIDAFDWVVEPNVLGMGLFALGDLFTTKPYVSGSNYIDKMSDYCSGCSFNPKTNCPIKSLYWAFLARHQPKLAEMGRMNLPLATLRRRSEKNRANDQRVFEIVTETLQNGERLTPDLFK